MSEKTTYYVLKEKAVPDVLLKVVAAKKLIEEKKCSVQEATEIIGISRSSFYKYKDDINPFHEDTKGKTVNVVIQLLDGYGRAIKAETINRLPEPEPEITEE